MLDDEAKGYLKTFAVFLLGMAAMYLWLWANGQIVALAGGVGC